MEYRDNFEIFKSNICHALKSVGDSDFIIQTLKSNRIRTLFDNQQYAMSLYLLAMVDYLSRENGYPICRDYNDIRKHKLETPIYPSSIVAMSIMSNSQQPKENSLVNVIPEFLRFNIVESEVRNVY